MFARANHAQKTGKGGGGNDLTPLQLFYLDYHVEPMVSRTTQPGMYSVTEPVPSPGPGQILYSIKGDLLTGRVLNVA